MARLNKKGSPREAGIVHLLVLILLIIGLLVGLYLVQKTQIFKPKAYSKPDVDPVLYDQRIAELRTKFNIPEDIPNEEVQEAVKEELLQNGVTVEGDIAQGEAEVKVVGDCSASQQTNFAFSEYGVFDPPLCLTEEQQQQALKTSVMVVETGADFIVAYSQAKQATVDALNLGEDMAKVRKLEADSGVADRVRPKEDPEMIKAMILSGADVPISVTSIGDGYAPTLIRIKELEQDVQENPDGSGKLSLEQEEARREYLLSLRTLWEKQHNVLIGLSEAVALSVIDKPLKIIGAVVQPIVGHIASYIPKNPVSDFLRHTWNIVIRKIPENIVKLQEDINNKAYYAYLNVKNVPRPLRSNAIDVSKAEKWINAHPEGIARETARAIINETRHISQEEFEEVLQKSVAEFKKGLNGEDYVVFVEPQKSNQWVAELAIPNMEYLPAQVYNLAPGSTTEGLTSVSRFVFFDDAIYSGSQMNINVQDIISKALSQGVDPSSITVDIIAPFGTVFGRDYIVSKTGQLYPNVKINFHMIEELPTMTESLSKYGSDVVNQGRKITSYNIDNNTLTYFDHKVPDSTSSVVYIYEAGAVYDSEGLIMINKHVPFIPETTPPYK